MQRGLKMVTLQMHLLFYYIWYGFVKVLRTPFQNLKRRKRYMPSPVCPRFVHWMCSGFFYYLYEGKARNYNCDDLNLSLHLRDPLHDDAFQRGSICFPANELNPIGTSQIIFMFCQSGSGCSSSYPDLITHVQRSFNIIPINHITSDFTYDKVTVFATLLRLTKSSSEIMSVPTS